MDWESKFGSIVRETESNLAKVKVRIKCKFSLCFLFKLDLDLLTIITDVHRSNSVRMGYGSLI